MCLCFAKGAKYLSHKNCWLGYCQKFQATQNPVESLRFTVNKSLYWYTASEINYSIKVQAKQSFKKKKKKAYCT